MVAELAESERISPKGFGEEVEDFGVDAFSLVFGTATFLVTSGYFVLRLAFLWLLSGPAGDVDGLLVLLTVCAFHRLPAFRRGELDCSSVLSCVAFMIVVVGLANFSPRDRDFPPFRCIVSC